MGPTLNWSDGRLKEYLIDYSLRYQYRRSNLPKAADRKKSNRASSHLKTLLFYLCIESAHDLGLTRIKMKYQKRR
jgi:hypothetical protein